MDYSIDRLNPEVLENVLIQCAMQPNDLMIEELEILLRKIGSSEPFRQMFLLCLDQVAQDPVKSGRPMLATMILCGWHARGAIEEAAI